jgi:hypothetical protein
MNKEFLSNNSLKRLGLFSFLICTLAICSCTKEVEGLGGDLVPTSDLVRAVESDTFALGAKLVWVDSVRTDRAGASGAVLIGSFEDELFGRTSCAANLQMDRIASSDVIPADWSVLRVELDLAVFSGSYAYGDERKMQYRVEQLGERMDIDSAYYSFSEVAHDQTNLMVSESPQSSSEVIEEEDASKNILRLKLDPSLGSYLLTAGTELVNDKDAFRDYFKGLRISTSTTAGKIARYDLGNSQTRLRVYYSTPFDPDVQNGRRVERYIDFGVSRSAGTLGHTEFFTEVSRSLVGTPLSGIAPNNPLDASQRILMQNGHIACEIDYSSFTSFIATHPLLIHNVDLVAPVLDVDNKERRRPFYMIALKELENVRNFYSAEPAFFQVVNAYAFNKSAESYRLDVTDLVRNNQEDASLESTFYLLSSNALMAVSRVEIAGPQYDVTNPSKNLRLVITYSERIENG